MGRFIFFLGEAYRALRRNAAPSIAAIVTIAITVLLVGVLVPVLKASGNKTEDVRDQIALKVFMFKDAGEQEINALQERVEGIPHVANVEYVSSDAALKVLEGDLEEKNILNALNNRNPLPPSFNVTLDDADNLESVQSALTPPSSEAEQRNVIRDPDASPGQQHEDHFRQRIETDEDGRRRLVATEQLVEMPGKLGFMCRQFRTVD